MAEENKDKNTNNRPDFPGGGPKKRTPYYYFADSGNCNGSGVLVTV